METGHAIVVIDDGSKDQTHLAICDLPIYYLAHLVNLGQGAAIQTGMEFALKMGAEYIVHFDADGQHNPEDLHTVLAPILNGKAEVVLGSRFLRIQDTLQVPFLRSLLLKMAIVVNGLFTGLWLSDAHNGFRAFSRLSAEQINLRENGFAHATEILGQIRKSGMKVVEIPVTIHYTDYSRQKGQSSLNALNILFELILNKLLK